MRKAAFIILIIGILLGFLLRDLVPHKPAAAKLVTISSRNLTYQAATRAKTIGEFLREQAFMSDKKDEDPSTRLPDGQASLGNNYFLSEPEASRRITNGMTIEIRKPLQVTIVDGGKEQAFITQSATVGDILYEQKIALAPTDRVKPDLMVFLVVGMKITIDRIVDLEVVEQNPISYEIKLEHDPGIFYGVQEVLVLGKTGRKEQKFLITYKNGVEQKRKLLRERVLEKPTAEIRKFGTKIEIEEAKLGRASWYDYKKCMCAAHPYYDLGRFLKVISGMTGKSIIVQINDRGPDMAIHPDRIIDLDSIAFKQLAPLGAGTIEVRVELLKN